MRHAERTRLERTQRYFYQRTSTRSERGWMQCPLSERFTCRGHPRTGTTQTPTRSAWQSPNRQRTMLRLAYATGRNGTRNAMHLHAAAHTSDMWHAGTGIQESRPCEWRTSTTTPETGLQVPNQLSARGCCTLPCFTTGHDESPEISLEFDLDNLVLTQELPGAQSFTICTYIMISYLHSPDP